MARHYLQLRDDLDEAALESYRASAESLEVVTSRLAEAWPQLHVAEGDDQALAKLATHRTVELVLPLDERFPLVGRPRYGETRLVRLGEASIGGAEFVVGAGPCSVESRDQTMSTAKRVAAAGARALRGGAWKPRTSPHDFQGLGVEGLAILRHAADATNLPVVTEVLEPSLVEVMVDSVDMFQVGARNMQNFSLLRALSEQPRPVLLKRGAGATWKEWMLAAEYLVMGGNEDVVLCERGIRTFETATRFTLDLASAALAKQESWLPVLIDPSHATGLPSLIGPMSAASLAAGMDGLLIEVHPRPEEALSDGDQALLPDEFDALMARLSALAPALGRQLASPSIANMEAS